MSFFVDYRFIVSAHSLNLVKKHIVSARAFPCAPSAEETGDVLLLVLARAGWMVGECDLRIKD